MSPERAQVWRRRALALGLGVLLLGAMELGARLLLGTPQGELYAEVPTSSSSLTERDGDHLVLAYQGDAATGPVALRPDPARRRVVWMGGSSMRGGNPGMPLAEEAAQRVGAALGVETVNMAAPGLDSGHHLALLPDVLALSPDAVVVYAGHNDLGNEVLMARFSGRGFQRTARLRWWLRHSRVFRALEDGLRRRAVLRLPEAGMQPRAAVDDAGRQRILGVFVQRMSALTRALQDAGVAVVLATPASNPITPSAVWSCPAALGEFGLQGRPPEAFPVRQVPRAQVVARLEAEPCRDLEWIRARLDGDQAALETLRDTDPLPFRADRALVEAMRTVAREQGAGLADVNERFRAIGGGVEHPALFIDPMHLSPTGHAAVAEVVAPVLADQLDLSPPRLAPTRLPRPDLADCGDLPCRVPPPPR